MKIKRIISGLMAVIMVISGLATYPATSVQAASAGDLKTGTNYMIVSKLSGKALTVSGYSEENSATLIQTTAASYASQVWKLEDAGNGYYRIVNHYSGKALDVPNASTKEGEAIIQWDKGDGENQKWKISDVGNGYSRISPKIKEDFGLNVSNNSKDDGAQIITWNYGDGADNMKWEFKEVSSVKENPQPEKADAKKAFDSFVSMYVKDKKLNNVSGFWAEAETVEMFIDAYERWGGDEYKNLMVDMAEWWITRRGSKEKEDWSSNKFNDDIMWAVIMFARVYLHTGEQKYLNLAKNNFDMCYGRAWTDKLDGGLVWQEGETTKNGCVNGPGAIAAVYVGKATGDKGYYEKAKKIVDWMDEKLVQDDGGVWDSLNWKTGEKNTWVSSYNQGTYIGACTMLYEYYGEQKYLDNAKKAAQRATKLNYNSETFSADAIGFKGILGRWWGYLALNHNIKDYNQFLQEKADSAWTNRNSDNLMYTKFGAKTVENIQNSKEDIDAGSNNGDNRTIGPYSAFGCSSATSWLINCADMEERQAELHKEIVEPDPDPDPDPNPNPDIEVEDIEVGPQPGNGDAVDIGNSSSSWDIKSPNGNTVISIKLSSGSLKYSVKQDGTTIVEESDMGINTSKGDFTSGLSFKSASAVKVHETYRNLSGIKEISTNHCHEATITFTKNSTEFQLIARAYDDGIAFRYKVNSSGTIKIEPDNEKTSFKLPYGSTVWYTNYYNSTGNFMYEKDYNPIDVKDLNKDSKIIIAQPMTYQVGSKYAMFTEAEKSGTYVGSFLQPEGNRVLRTIFDKKQEKAVETSAPFQTPWRALVIGDANTIVTNSMVENLSPAPDEKYKFEEWVNPGVSSWSWVGNWGQGISDQTKKETHMNWIDLASEMGWRYYIMDEGWQPKSNVKDCNYKGMRDWFPEVRDYAKEKGVELIAWVHQNDMNTAAEREERFKEWSEQGIKGIKIDFFYYEDQSMLQLHRDVYETAAKYKMLVNVHGSNPPSGERRTYPNVLAREAIKGQEQGGITAYQYCILPFTRTAVGTADVTEELYSKDANKTSMGYQIALSVLIENGIRSLGGKPSDYLGIPSAVSYYKNFPAKWDETKLLDSKIGEYVNIARRSGDGWYAAGISVDERNLSLKTDFLEEDQTYTAILYHEKDKDERKDLRTEIKKNITKNSTLDFHIQKGGGYAVKIYPQTGGSLKSVRAFPSALKMAVNGTKDVKVMLNPSNSPMHDFEWDVKDASIASIEKTAEGATVKGLKEGKTQITGTSAFDESKVVTIDVEVTADPFPVDSGRWKVINNNGKYRITGENSVKITAESGVIQNNVFSMSIPNNSSNFSIEAKISGGLADNYQGGFIGVFKESLGNDFVGVGRRYHTGMKVDNSANLFAMMSGNDEKYAKDSDIDGDAYVKLEKSGSKYTGYYKRGSSGSWSKIAEMNKSGLSDSKNLRIGVYTGCGGGSSAVDITFTDFKFNGETINFANRNENASTGEVYTVEFDTAGGNAIGHQFLEEGGKVAKPEDPKKGDFKFLGWYVNGKEYNFDSGVKEDLLLTAKWEGEYANLVLEAEEGTLSGSAKVTEAAEASNGYVVGELGGEEKGTVTFNVSADIADTRTLKLYFATEQKRKFQVIVNDNQKVNVTCAKTDSWTTPSATPETVEIDLQKGENKITISGVGKDAAPNLDKIELGVTTDEGKSIVEKLIESIPETVSEEDKSLVLAVKKSYESLVAEGGSAEVVGLAKLEKAVAAVNGTMIDPELSQAQANYKIQAELLAKYDEKEYPAASWKAAQDALATAKAEYEKGDKADAATLKNLVNALTEAMNALKKIETFTVKFDVKGAKEEIADITVNGGEKVKKPADPVKPGSEFEYWVFGGKEYDFDTPVTENITLVARWKVIDELATAKSEFEAADERIAELDETLYSQDSWEDMLDAYEIAKAMYDEGDEVEDIAAFLEAVQALTEAIDELKLLFNVTFDLAGGTPAVEGQHIAEGECVKLPTANLAKAGCIFAGWYLDGQMYDFNTPVTRDITLVAMWKATPVQQPKDNTVKVQQMVIEAESTKIAAGKKVELSAVVVPDIATNKSVTWSSSNEKYATVSADGVVTTKKAGKNKSVVITATATDGSGVTAQITIKIMEKAVKKVTLKANKTVKAGKSIRVKATVTPKTKKANTKLVWSSSNTDYATVKASGVVKTKKAGKGKTVKITARATDGSGKKDTIKIKIK